jgi:hypothetical protein
MRHGTTGLNLWNGMDSRQGWRLWQIPEVFALQKLEGVKLHGCSFTPAQGIEAE